MLIVLPVEQRSPQSGSCTEAVRPCHVAVGTDFSSFAVLKGETETVTVVDILCVTVEAIPCFRIAGFKNRL